MAISLSVIEAASTERAPCRVASCSSIRDGKKKRFPSNQQDNKREMSCRLACRSMRRVAALVKRQSPKHTE